MQIAEYFLEKADQCFRLARLARRNPTSSEIPEALEVLGYEFMAKAVEIDTIRDRAKKR